MLSVQVEQTDFTCSITVTLTNATIQVGSATPVPEFNLGMGIIVFAALSAAIIIVRTRRRVMI